MLRKKLVRQVDPEEEAKPEKYEAHHAEDECDLKSISSAFYKQLLRMQIPKVPKVAGNLMVFFVL